MFNSAPTINRQLRNAFICLLMLAASSVARATVDAELDRDQINEGDTIALTIKVSGDNDAEPDLSILEKDFDIVSQSQSSSFVFNNYQQNSSREWRLQMFPKNSGDQNGTVTIPEINVGNEKTPALQVQIRKRDARTQSADGSTADPVFIRVSLDTDSAYVQQEVIITAQIYQAIQLDNMQMSDPAFDNATVKEVQRTSYQTTENGIDYRVHELRYALYPREAGELIIPEFVFSARKLTNASSFFSMPTADMMVRRLSKPLTLKVKPIPAAFTGKVWLPARSLRLKEEWRDDPLLANTGKAITRSVIIEANGLLAAQLPELPKPAVEGLQAYPDQAVLADQETANGIRSTREEPTALIPTRPGTITLPEIRLSWWDVDEDRQKEAVLPASKLDATGNALQIATPPAPTAAKADHADNASTTQPASPDASNITTTATDTTTQTVSDSTLWLWQGLTIVAFIGWLMTALLWWQARKTDSTSPETRTALRNSADDYRQQEKNLFKKLRDSCRSGDLKQLRQDLLAWAASAWHTAPPATLDEISQRLDSRELALILQQLDAQLYGGRNDHSSINIEQLLAIIESWRRHGKVKHNNPPVLADLYDN